MASRGLAANQPRVATAGVEHTGDPAQHGGRGPERGRLDGLVPGGRGRAGRRLRAAATALGAAVGRAGGPGAAGDRAAARAPPHPATLAAGCYLRGTAARRPRSAWRRGRSLLVGNQRGQHVTNRTAVDVVAGQLLLGHDPASRLRAPRAQLEGVGAGVVEDPDAGGEGVDLPAAAAGVGQDVLRLITWRRIRLGRRAGVPRRRSEGGRRSPRCWRPPGGSVAPDPAPCSGPGCRGRPGPGLAARVLPAVFISRFLLPASGRRRWWRTRSEPAPSKAGSPRPETDQWTRSDPPFTPVPGQTVNEVCLDGRRRVRVEGDVVRGRRSCSGVAALRLRCV